MDYIFYKNQAVDLFYEDNSIKVIAKQNSNTPGVFMKINLDRNKKYLLHVVGFKRSIKTVRLWFANIKNQQLYYDPMELGKTATEIKRVLFSKVDMQLKFGLLFVNPKIGDYFIIKSIALTDLPNPKMNINGIKIIQFNNMPSILLSIMPKIPTNKNTTLNETTFFKNQLVDIAKIKNSIRVISRQVKSTPGIYAQLRINKNKSYLVNISYSKKNSQRIAKLWIAYGNTTVYSVNDQSKKRIMIKKIVEPVFNTTIKIGILFVNPKIGDFLIINKFVIQEFDRIMDKNLEKIVIGKKNIIKKKTTIKVSNLIKTNFSNSTVQILFPFQGKRIYFMRTLLLPTKKRYNVLYLIPKKCRQFINNNLIYKKMLNSILFINDWQEILTILEKVNPVRILLTITPHKNMIEKMYKYKDKICYVHHGVILDDKASPIIKKKWNSDIKYMIPNGIGKNILIRGGIKSKNITLIDGLPQFDYILLNSKNNLFLRNKFVKKYKISTRKKIILLINGSANTQYYRNGTFIDQIINLLNSLKLKGVDNFLIIKNKYETTFNIDGNNVVCLTNDDVIYDYFFADVVIVVEGGTALIEALLGVYDKTIFIDWYNRNDDIFKTQQLNLIKANNTRELGDLIEEKLTHNRYQNINSLKSEANKYIKSILGYTNIQLVSNKILTLVKQ